MRASLRALAVAALALTTASFAAAAKGGKASEDRKDFTGVEVQAGIRAIISIADRRVTVEGDEDSVARVRTEVHDGVLEIGWEKSRAGSLPVMRWVAEEETRLIRPSPRPSPARPQALVTPCNE